MIKAEYPGVGLSGGQDGQPVGLVDARQDGYIACCVLRDRGAIGRISIK
ncbi:MAG: hypothetical protein HQK59_15375 [Deltaproteobacteria bacterium]|nr:hypothetical protein [Deltaproteobacteria bacterium]